MLAFAIALEATNIKVNAASPGFTKTALNNFNGTRSVEEGARSRPSRAHRGGRANRHILGRGPPDRVVNEGPITKSKS